MRGHKWRTGNPEEASTPWQCENCGQSFLHRPEELGLSVSMEKAGVSKECPETFTLLADGNVFDILSFMDYSPTATIRSYAIEQPDRKWAVKVGGQIIHETIAAEA